MKIFNKVIFTICFLISCFIFSDKVFAVNELNSYVISASNTSATSYTNFSDNKFLLEEVQAHINCRDTEYNDTSNMVKGMVKCAKDVMDSELKSSYKELPVETIYSKDKTKIIKKHTLISYFVTRIDATVNYKKQKNQTWILSWAENENMKTVIYPGMNLEYNVTATTDTEGKEDWNNRIITGIKIEKPEAPNMDPQIGYSENYTYKNENGEFATSNLLLTYGIYWDQYKVIQNWTGVGEKTNGGYVESTSPDYGHYNYTIEIDSLLANENNGLRGMGYNGTTINMLQNININGNYTIKSDVNKSWAFHYLVPLKEIITYVEIFPNTDACIKNKEDMTPQERAKCFKCETYRTDKDKDSYVKEGCCTGTDSANASSEWCCKDDTYFNNNKTKCCSSEKSTSYKGLYFPDKLASQFDEVCCKDQVYFDTSDNNKICCEKEKATSFRGFYFPDIYAFRYDEKCGNGEPDCKDESTFNANHDYCCAREKAIGNSLPKGLTYKTAKCESKGVCETDKDVRKHPISCCKQLENENKTGTDLYKNNCKIKIEIKDCDDGKEEFNYTSPEPNYIKVEDKISFSNSQKQQTIESGTGFEYTADVTNTTKITMDYSTDLGERTDEKAEEYATKVANKINNTIDNLNKNIESALKYPNQKIYFNYKEMDEVKFSNETGKITKVDKLPMLFSTQPTSKKFSQPKKEVIFKYYIEHDNGYGISKEDKTIIKEIYDTSITSVTNTYKIALPHAYIHKNTGEVIYFFGKLDLTDSTNYEYAKNYYYGGNKFYTDENDISKTIDFNITIEKGGASGKINTSADSFTCQTDTYNCINDDVCCETQPCNKYVEDNGYFYRRISLTKPFPNREAGSNWNRTTIDGKSYQQKYIKEDVYSGKPMYEITLTSELINQIKEYNSKTTYFDWNMDNNKDKQSTSKFLSGTASGADFMANEVKFWGEKNTGHLNRTTRYGEDKVIVKGLE